MEDEGWDGELLSRVALAKWESEPKAEFSFRVKWRGERKIKYKATTCAERLCPAVALAKEERYWFLKKVRIWSYKTIAKISPLRTQVLLLLRSLDSHQDLLVMSQMNYFTLPRNMSTLYRVFVFKQ